MTLKHRMSGTTEYLAWRNMRYRCGNPNHHAWKNYGARGITVCDEWNTNDGGFEAFFAHIGPKPCGHTLDRIDNARSYEHGNVRWVQWTAQIRNRRVARMITALGKTQNLSAWAEESGISKQTISYRLRSGWSSDDAVSTPVSADKKNPRAVVVVRVL